MAFPNNNLPSDAKYWVREVEKKIVNLENSLSSSDINNTTRDSQLQVTASQALIAAQAADDAATEAGAAADAAAQAAQDALDAIDAANAAGSLANDAQDDALAALQDIIDLGSPGGPSINASNINAGSISADFISGGTIDASDINGVTITGGTINGAYVTGVTIETGGEVSASEVNCGILYASQNATLNSRIISEGTYNSVASQTANLYINTNNYFQRTTSSRRYKSDIQDVDYGLKAFELRPRTWVDKSAYEENNNSSEGLTRITGFIAEEIDELGLTELVQYNEDGSPEAVNYDRIMVAIVPILKHQQSIIESLTARIEALETN